MSSDRGRSPEPSARGEPCRGCGLRSKFDGLDCIRGALGACMIGRPITGGCTRGGDGRFIMTGGRWGSRRNSAGCCVKVVGPRFGISRGGRLKCRGREISVSLGCIAGSDLGRTTIRRSGTTGVARCINWGAVCDGAAGLLASTIGRCRCSTLATALELGLGIVLATCRGGTDTNGRRWRAATAATLLGRCHAGRTATGRLGIRATTARWCGLPRAATGRP